MLLPELTRPLTRLLGRGTGRWLQFCYGDEAQARTLWSASSRRYRVFYDRQIRAYVSVDLTEWYGRLHYFTGRYYDQANQRLIKQHLRPGDGFIDIGANYGMHTLAASRIVGDRGRVLSFEPNPETFKVLAGHVGINRMDNCTVIQAGLSNESGELLLSGDDRIKLSFRYADAKQNAVRVPVVVGDDVLADQPLPPRLLVKIDTEGFEHRVIQGLRKTLSKDRVAVSVEVTDAWLRDTGSSAAEMFQELQSHGFTPVLLGRDGVGTNATPLSAPLAEHQYDVLFAKPAFFERG